MQYQARLDEAESRYNQLTAQMADPAVINDAENYRKTAKAQSELEELIAKYQTPRRLPDCGCLRLPRRVRQGC